MFDLMLILLENNLNGNKNNFRTAVLIRINLPLFYTVVPSSPILDGTTVENKGKLILTEIFPSVQKHDIF